MLDDRIASQLRERYERRISEGSLPSEAQLGAWYATFRERFAPEVLQRLDGEALLNAMHLHGSRDSMVYWLEFKNDEEFPNIFGSIAGGSALKFGIYRSSETGQWMTGSPQRQRVLTLDEAVERARQHRDQLVRAAGLVAALPDQADNLDYIRLQADLEREAPDIHDTAWGHKYINLLFPQKLDDFHVIDFQRHHLIKLLQVPPVDPGRYRSAGRFVAIARSLGMHLSHLTMLLHERDGRPHRYWRIGTSDGTDPMNRWPPMLEGRYVAIGWHELGDLSELTYDITQASWSSRRAAQRTSRSGVSPEPTATSRPIRRTSRTATRSSGCMSASLASQPTRACRVACGCWANISRTW